jgi:very-short-patch-repair endonuclease
MHGLAAELVAAILSIADRQFGLITHEQLLRCGLDRRAINRLVARGWLRRVHRGVYLVGHAATVPLMRETAALLAYTPSALLAHRSSLVIWAICPPSDALDVHVLVRGRKCRPRDGIAVHRSDDLHEVDVGRRHGLSLTMPARALLEAASDMDSHELERAVDEALALGLTDRPALLAVTERYPRLRGVKILRELADPNKASEITKSRAEAAYASLLRKVKAPPSQTQYPIGPYKADRAWPELKLVVEIDGVRFHRDGKRMEEDNARQDFMRHLGHAVTRFTRRQVVYEPEYVMFKTGQEIGLAMAKAAGSTG